MHNRMKVYNYFLLQVDSLPKDDGTLLKKREELQKEVEQTKRALATQVSLPAMLSLQLFKAVIQKSEWFHDHTNNTNIKTSVAGKISSVPLQSHH